MNPLAARYRELILEYRNEPSVRLANRLANDVQREYLRLVASEDGRAAIVSLLDDGDRRVRLSSARGSLLFATDRARPVLEEIARGSDMSSFRAKIALSQFDDGSLVLDSVPDPEPRTPAQVSGAALDQTLQVHGLIMNGGLWHSWAMDSTAFLAAVDVFRAIRRKDAAMILYAASNIFRNAVLEDGELNENDGDREERLTNNYYELPDPQDSIEATQPFDEEHSP